MDRNRAAFAWQTSFLCLFLFTSSPAFAELSDIFRLAAGGRHSCAMDTNLSVFCWGSNSHGQIGINSSTDQGAPRRVGALGNDINAITAGGSHTCALTNNGDVQCWGANDQGQVGDGTSADRWLPTAVGGIGFGLTVGAGAFHSCAFDTSGEVLCWGRNSEGQLGDGSRENRALPGPVAGLGGAQELYVGAYHNCVVTPTAGARCWGNNEMGQLGDGTREDRTTPVDVVGLSGPVMALAPGLNHTCAQMSDGTLQCWGGFLGDVPTTIGGFSDVAAVNSGGLHVCAITGAQALFCAGVNNAGQLGDGTTTDAMTAVPVMGHANDVAQVAGGGLHTCSANNAGAVLCWGANESGQLGRSGQ